MSEKHRFTKEELEAHLEEQLGFLARSAKAFDDGIESEAKRLASVVRLLVNDTGRSHSLLKQLGAKDVPFLDSTCPITEGNLVSEHPLLALQFGGGEVCYAPLFDSGPSKYVTFAAWWDGVVFVDKDGHRITRKDLVLSMADQDGGAHVDPVLNSRYAAISKRNSLGWVVAIGEAESYALQGAERAAMRQIAHEVLKTLSPTYSAPSANVTAASPTETFDRLVFDEQKKQAAEGRGGRRPEIFGGKMRFYPEAGDFFFRNDGLEPTALGAEYTVEMAVDSISEGNVRGVVGASVGPEIRTPGIHRFVIRAGADQVMGVFGSSTDAILDSYSVRAVG